jgi:hypothetical protein
MTRSKKSAAKAKSGKTSKSAKSAKSLKKAKSGKERRRMKRWKVAVLVRAAIPKLGSEVFDIEMWAKDVSEKGMQLEWSRGLNASHIGRDVESRKEAIRFDDVNFEPGTLVKVQDLFYDDDGSPFIEGKITWIRRLPNENCSVGVEFTDAKKQPQALLGAFKDFLSIVKNPTAAIAKATRRK